MIKNGQTEEGILGLAGRDDRRGPTLEALHTAAADSAQRDKLGNNDQRKLRSPIYLIARFRSYRRDCRHDPMDP